MVLSEGAIGGIARCFEVTAQRLAHLVPPLADLLGGIGRSGDGTGANHAQERLLDGVVDALSAERNAVRAAIVHAGPAAAVAWNAVPRARVS